MFALKSQKARFNLKSIHLYVLVITVISIFLFCRQTPDAYPSMVGHAINVRVMAPATAAPENFGVPVNLKIPDLGIDSNIELAGLMPNGQMAVPVGLKNVGWYRYGTRPGNIGTAVIDGHYGIYKNGDISVFQILDKIIIGSKIYSTDVNGNTSTFQVKDIRSYSSLADSSAIFGSNDGKAHLNLITCGGPWDNVQMSYINRLVVFADKLND